MGNTLVKGENDLATLQPYIAEEWDYDKNIGLRPEDFTSKSGKKVWWKCRICENTWQATIHNRVCHRTGCPYCAKHMQSSFPEQAIYYYIMQLFPDAVNKYIYSGQKEIDVYIPSLKIGIEHDGVNWHDDAQRDEEKNRELRELGIWLIRVRESCGTKHAQPAPEGTGCIIEYNSKGDEHFTGDESLSIAIAETLRAIYLLKIRQVPPMNIDHLIDLERDTGAIMKQYYTCLREKSLAVRYPEIASEWDYEKNGALTPDKVPYGFNRNVWWRCKEYGHSFSMAVKTRTAMKCSCPYCTRHRVLPGFNDLATTHPEIAVQWDYDRNELKPSEVLSGNRKKVWWKCRSCGQSYLMSIVYRINHDDTRCPICNGKTISVGINDLATTHPEVAAQWDYDRNTRKPTEVTFGPREEVWWKCNHCGGSYLMRISTKACQNQGCPYCSGHRVLAGFNDLDSRYPFISAEWDYDKNAKTPAEVSYGSKDKAWWKCSKCGCSWEAVICNRTKANRPTGCPQCGRKRRSKLNSRSVICIETQVVYDGVVDAEKTTGINRHFISACCKGSREIAGGFHWQYADAEI